MNANEFIKVVRIAVYSAAVNGTVDVLEHPPGRKPSEDIVELSRWYNGLSVEDRECVSRVAKISAGQAVYNFLLILDGLLAIESSSPKKGRLELLYNDGLKLIRLNDDNVCQLSSLFKEND